jgi:hypothetical protein
MPNGGSLLSQDVRTRTEHGQSFGTRHVDITTRCLTPEPEPSLVGDSGFEGESGDIGPVTHIRDGT